MLQKISQTEQISYWEVGSVVDTHLALLWLVGNGVTWGIKYFDMKCDICKRVMKKSEIGRGYGKFVCGQECFKKAGDGYVDKSYRPWTSGINN